MKKYELTTEIFKSKNGEVLYRIKALKDFHIDECNIDIKKGDLGGFISSEKNLSHNGTCWIHDDAKVYNEAIVKDDAQMFNNSAAFGFSELSGSAVMFDDSWIGNSAKVFDLAEMHNGSSVYGNGRLCGNASIGGDACIMSNALVTDDSIIEGNACIAGSARIYGNTFIAGESMIYEDTKINGKKVTIGGNAKIRGNTELYGSYVILDNAKIGKSKDVLSLYCSKLYKDNVLTFYKVNKKDIYVAMDYNAIPLNEFIETFTEDKRDEALRLVDFVKKEILTRAV